MTSTTRRLLTVLVPLLVMAPARTADAGLGSLVRGLSKAGKVAKGGAAAKAGKVVVGGKALTAGAAASTVFTNAGVDASRVAMYVTDGASDGLRVVLRGGEELNTTARGLRGLVDDLDVVASVDRAAGVDVFVDARVARRVGDLDVGPNTRVWLANADGTSVPMRAADDGLQLRVGGDWWMNVVPDLLLDVAQIAATSVPRKDIVVIDPDCEQAPAGARHAVGAPPRPGAGTVVWIVDRSLDPVALPPAVKHHLVVHREVCTGDGAVDDDAAALVADLRNAATVGELWGALEVEALERGPANPLDRSNHGVLEAGGLRHVHRVPPDLVDPPEGDASSSDMPAWFPWVGMLVLLGLVGLKLRAWLTPGHPTG